MKLLTGLRGRASRALDRPRAALTLAETLIAMGILAIGLLGVAAVFPVGGFYVESGDIADRGGAVAQAALADAVIRGYLDPENWIVHDVNSLVVPAEPPVDAARRVFYQANAQKHFMRLLSGETFVPEIPPSIARRMGLRDALLVSTFPGNDPTSIVRRSIETFTVVPVPGDEPLNLPVLFRTGVYGGAFVIDPIGMAGALADASFGPELVFGQNNGTFAISSPVHNFPGFINDEQLFSVQWAPWTFPRPDGSDDPPASVLWPVRRVTTVHGLAALNTPPGSTTTNSWVQLDSVATDFFNTTDDLAQFFPDAGDEPVRQRWESFTAGSSAPRASVRQARGDYSWLISVAPGSAEAVDSLASDPGSHPVEVSAVVFFKRTPARGPQATADAERLVSARVVSASPSGGELLLRARTPGGSIPNLTEPETSPFTDLRPGQFVMVTGPHPQSTLSNPQLAVRWCQVLNIQESGTVAMPGDSPMAVQNVSVDGDRSVLVALRGPDWPWQPAATNGAQLLSNDLRVAILPGAVAVHTKTLRLESGSEWSIE